MIEAFSTQLKAPQVLVSIYDILYRLYVLYAVHDKQFFLKKTGQFSEYFSPNIYPSQLIQRKNVTS